MPLKIRPAPAGRQTANPYLVVDDAAEAIEARAAIPTPIDPR